MRISDWSSDVCSSDLQRQKWYLARFLGADSDVHLATSHPEFRAWKWASAQELPHMIVPFKRRLYADIVEAFGDWLKSRAIIAETGQSSLYPRRPSVHQHPHARRNDQQPDSQSHTHA